MNVKGLNVVIGADARDFNKTMSDISSNVYGLNRELRDVNKSLKFDTKNPDLLAQRTKILNERFEETKKKLEAMKLAQNDVDKSFKDGKIDEEGYRKFNTELAQTESQLKNLEKQFKEAQKEMLKYDGVMGKVTSGLENVGETMTKTGKKLAPYSAIATGMLGGMFKMATDFDSAWTGVQKTMSDDITPQQLDSIKQGLKDMSKQTGVSTTELSNVAEAAGQLGIETDSVLDFTRVMIDMGRATNLSSEQGATELARFANIVGMSQGDFSRLGSVIVELGNNFATTESEISAMSLNLAAAGSQIGMSESDIVALATSLSSVGLEAAGGGTAFSRLMVDMQLAVETGNESLQDFAKVSGMTGEQFQKAFKEDATGALQAFISGLSETGDEGDSAIKILDDMGITQTKLRDAILRSSGASDIFADATKRGKKAWESNSALAEEAALRYDSMQGKIDKAKASFEVMAIELGDHLLPIMSDFFEWVAKVADKFGNLDEGTQKFIVGITGTVAVAAPLLLIGGKMSTALGSITGFIGSTGKALGLIKISGTGVAPLIGGVGTAASGATAGVAAAAGSTSLLSTAFASLTGPVGIGVAAVAAGGLAINNVMSEEVVPAVDLFADGMDYTNQKIDEFGNSSGAVAVVISEETKTMLGSYLEMSEGISEMVTALYAGTEEATKENVENLKSQTDEMVSSILEKNNERKNGELEIISELFENAEGLTEENKLAINSTLSQDYQEREVKTQGLRDELKALYDEMAENAEGGTLEQKQRVDKILGELKESAADVMTQSAVEREVIMQRYNAYEGRVTAEQASKIIGELEQQRLDTVEKAESSKNEQIRIAEELRAKGGKSAEDAADKIIKEANKQYDEQVAAANKGKTDATDKLIEANKELSESVDLESGKIKTGWDNISKWWKNLSFPTKIAKIEETYVGSRGNSNQGGTGDYGPRHNNGLMNVPYNDYQAILHRDERVLTAYENRKFQNDGYLGNPELAQANSSVSNIDNSTVNNSITLSGTYHIREESDIEKIAQQLHRLQFRKSRA